MWVCGWVGGGVGIGESWEEDKWVLFACSG